MDYLHIIRPERLLGLRTSPLGCTRILYNASDQCPKGGGFLTNDLKFFYFGYQCPHNAYLLARIKTIAWQERAKLHLFDVSNDEETCKNYSIFSPTMVIVNDKYRWHGPFSKETILEMLEDEGVEPVAQAISQSEDVVRGNLVPITPDSVLQTCVPCINVEDKGLCMGKSEWVRDMIGATGLKNLGYLHFHEGKCVGGAEFLPSIRVPYPIPDKREDNAFLTCSYISNEIKDFRAYPLERLIVDLRSSGFKTLSVAASEKVVFPNGPMAWFTRKGFEDKGILHEERMHGAKIHYLQLGL